jgi:hypothetical protein
MQSGLDVATNHPDPEVTVVVDQPGSVEDGEHSDVSRPAEVVPHEHVEVCRVQAFQAAGLGHHIHPLPLC